MIAWPSSTEGAIGFSTSTCTPRSMQQNANSRCKWVGAAMVTASTPFASSGSTPLNAGQPSARETKSRCLLSGSATQTSLTPGRSAKTRAWLLPMTPTPTTPTRSRRSASRFPACTMIDEFPPAASRNESLLARPKAAGDGPVWSCGHVLNQRVTSPGVIAVGSIPSLLAEPENPIDEAAIPPFARLFGPDPDGALEIGHVRIGLRNVARLHREQLPPRRLAEGFLDQPHDLGHLDRPAVADIVDVPRCPARGGIGGIAPPDPVLRPPPRHRAHPPPA